GEIRRQRETGVGQDYGRPATQNAGSLSDMPQRTPRRPTTQEKGITFSDGKQSDDAGKRSAVKVARCVWRGAFGTGQYCTSPGAYPTLTQRKCRATLYHVPQKVST